MIHQLEVSPELSLRELEKLSRKFAMTGGYELSLKPALAEEQLAAMTELYITEALKRPTGTSQFKASNAFRILELIVRHPNCSEDARRQIQAEVLALAP